MNELFKKPKDVAATEINDKEQIWLPNWRIYDSDIFIDAHIFGTNKHLYLKYYILRSNKLPSTAYAEKFWVLFIKSTL